MHCNKAKRIHHARNFGAYANKFAYTYLAALFRVDGCTKAVRPFLFLM